MKSETAPLLFSSLRKLISSQNWMLVFLLWIAEEIHKCHIIFSKIEAAQKILLPSMM